MCRLHRGRLCRGRSVSAAAADAAAVTSAKTFDAGVAVYGVMAALSMTGTAWVVGKKRV